eukprot:COSAG04_NODE_3725_length_2581_cov_11.469030_1_plen_282_part_00
MRLAAGAELLEPHPLPTMTWALRRAPRMAAPQPRTDLRGYGLQREVDSAEREAKAAQLEEKVLRTISELGALLAEFSEFASWDEGKGQKAFIEVANRSGRDRLGRVAEAGQEETFAVDNVGPDKETVVISTMVPHEGILNTTKTGVTVFPIRLPPYFYPKQDHRWVTVLHALADILPEAQLSFLKVPTAHPNPLVNQEATPMLRKTPPEALDGDGAEDSKRRRDFTAVDELRTSAERIAFPESSFVAYGSERVGHYGREDNDAKRKRRVGWGTRGNEGPCT